MKGERVIRIGTRKSQLAIWQARKVQQQLEDLGYRTTLVQRSSSGDKNQQTPLYAMGIVGVFTRTLDMALLQGEIDIAVHSMKDVPTLLPDGIVQAAVMTRGSFRDLVVTSGPVDFEKPCTIATSSLRRKAQWLHRYPHHRIVNLRGNVNTRLEKVKTQGWEGAIFAKAGLERIARLPKHYRELDWMLPAPAQGAIMIAAKSDHSFVLEACRQLNDEQTYKTTYVERQFLRALEGGCSAPIGALAVCKGNELLFKGNLFALDGKRTFSVQIACPIEDYTSLAERAAQQIFDQGGRTLMRELQQLSGRQK